MFDTNVTPLNYFCLLYLATCKVLCGCKQNLAAFIFGRAYRTIFLSAVVVVTVATFFSQSAKAENGFFEDKGYLFLSHQFYLQLTYNLLIRYYYNYK